MKPRPRLTGTKAFSLVEILAAVAVLGLLGLILSQITGSIVRTTKQSTRAIDASGQARIAFDRLGLDLAGLIKRKDLDFTGRNFATAGTDPILLFLSQVTSSGLASSNNRDLSFIAYEVRPHPDNKDMRGAQRPCLVRAGKAIPWSATGAAPAAGFMGLQANGLPQTFAGSTFPSALLPGNPQDFDLLAAGAIRMVVGFQLYPDNRPVQLADNYIPTPDYARGQIVYSPPVRTVTGSTGATGTYVDLSRVSALVIGLVVIDLESLRLASADQVALLGNAFPTPADGANRTPVQVWTATANAAFSLPESIPLQVRQAVRVYERTYPVTSFPTQGP